MDIPSPRKAEFYMIQVIGWVLFVFILIGQTTAVVSYKTTVAWGLNEPETELTQAGVAMNYGTAIADTIIQLPLLCSGLIGLTFGAEWSEECLLAAAGIALQWSVAWLVTMGMAARLTPAWNIPEEAQVFHFFLIVPIALLGFSYIVYVADRRSWAAGRVAVDGHAGGRVGVFAAIRAYDPEYWLVCFIAILTAFGLALDVEFCFFSENPADWTHRTRVVWAYVFGWVTAEALVCTPMLVVGIAASLFENASSWWRTLVTPMAGVAIYAPVVYLASMITARGLEDFDFDRFSTQHMWMGLTLVEVWGIFWMMLRLMRASLIPYEKEEAFALLAEESKRSGDLPVLSM
mmetsp:Transcript_31777/g.59218  ORF Transcript_31777/g.59218 Transcript_31777/m.59218 type:complete len:347 (-) Transcript_31777:204-1244(-)